MIQITRGLDLPLAGEPEQTIETGQSVSRVAVIGDDFIGMKPTMEVTEGDTVRRGDLLFTDKKTVGVRYTSPGAGTVIEVNRGEKRHFQSVVIHLDGDEAVTFDGVAGANVESIARETVADQLNEGGLWSCFRTRPFSKVPALGSEPHSIFVQAMDTSPHAADPVPIIQDREDDFVRGLRVISKLTPGSIFVCKKPEVSLPGGEVERVRIEEFDGPHPAGLPGTHIHHLDPVGLEKTVWTISAQDVIAIGEFYRTGQYPIDRVIAIGGPCVEKPRLVRTRLGAALDELLGGELSAEFASNPEACRVISGSVLAGRTAAGPYGFLGRYHNQVSVLQEGTHREMIGWLLPGADKNSVTGLYLGGWMNKKFKMTTNQMGSKRAMVPIGTYEQVMPLDILPTYLLRALIVNDTTQAAQLGALELDEEDIALCTYVCPGKFEYGSILRETLDLIEREG